MKGCVSGGTYNEDGFWLQMVGYAAADPLCQVLSIVQDLLQGRRSKLSRQRGIHVHEVVSDLLRKVHGVAKKVKVCVCEVFR